MDELYVEQIVKREDNRLAGLIKAAVIAVVVLLFLAGVMTMHSVLMLVGIAIGFAAFYFIFPRLSVEFEYLYVSKELTIDRIYNKETRKTAGEWNLTSMELFAPVSSSAFDSYRNRKGNTVLDFTSGTNEEGKYAIVINDKKLTILYIEPDEELKAAIKSQFPRQSK